MAKPRISQRAARIIPLLPGCLLISVPIVFNPWVLGLLSEDGRLSAYNLLRIRFFAVVFLLLGGVHCLLVIRHLRSKTFKPVSPRRTGIFFSLEMFVCLLLMLEAGVGIKTAGLTPIPDMALPDAVRSWRLLPEHDRLILHSRPDQRRILFLGDSVTYGYGIEAEAAVPAQLQRRLGPGYAVMNAGVPGYDLEQDYYALLDLMETEPSLVILGVCLNDVAFANDRRLRGDFSAQPPSLANRLRWGLKAHSGLLNAGLLVHPRDRFLQATDVKTFVQDAIDTLLQDPQVLDRQCMLAMQWLGQIVAECDRRSVRLLVVVFPFRAEFHGEDWARLNVIERRIKTECEAAGIEAFDLSDEFGACAQAHGTADDLFIDYDHFSAKGGAIAAEAVARRIESDSLRE